MTDKEFVIACNPECVIRQLESGQWVLCGSDRHLVYGMKEGELWYLLAQVYKAKLYLRQLDEVTEQVSHLQAEVKRIRDLYRFAGLGDPI